MSLGVNIDRAVNHGLELVCQEIIKDSDKYTPIATSALRNSIRYEMKGHGKAQIISGEGTTNGPKGRPISDYAEKQYFGNTAGKSGSGKKLRHIGDFSTGLQSIVSQYAGKLTKGAGKGTRYSAAWRLADEAGALKWVGQPRWIERAYFNGRKKMQKIFASAFRPGRYK